MTLARTGIVGLLCGVLGTAALGAADFSSYRGLRFGMSIAAAETQAGTNPSGPKVIHRRPAAIQQIDWRPASATQTDPVQNGVLQFVDGQLSRIVVTYDRNKVEGMTAEDMIEVLSATYGAASKPDVEIAYRSLYGETAKVLARWENPEYAYDLVRTGDQSSFAVILYSKRLDALAQAAILEAVRLDKAEEPQRELELQARRDEVERLKLEKARSVNKPNFRP